MAAESTWRRPAAAVLGAVLATTCAAAAAQATPPSRSQAHDGRWTVVLVCDDVKRRGPLVKGYQFTFMVEVHEGRLAGGHGRPGEAGSVVFAGEVLDGGVLEIRAQGRTSSFEHTFGNSPPGTPYQYTMHGNLGASQGEAVRRELRPCRAAFSRS